MHPLQLSIHLAALAVGLLVPTAAANAQGIAPLQDVGFAPATPEPDPDLVIVRERAYGAEGVDLSPFLPGAGVEQYVQSVYFRFFVDNDANADSFTGRVVFPPPIRILGIITDGTQLGGEPDDGAWTATDALFGIGGDPDAYSESGRGFECCGGVATSEFVCAPSERTLVFGLNVTTGVDEFRVILDYGDSFPPELAFDVATSEIPLLGGAVPDIGIRVGDEVGAVLGSGDFGEVEGLVDIPLTASSGPCADCGILAEPLDSVWILRDTSGDTFVDGYDAALALPAPDRFAISSSFISAPAGVTAGPDGLLYVLAIGTGYATIDVRGGVALETALDDPPGERVDLAWIPGARELYFLRDTTGDTFVEVFDPDQLVVTRTIAVSSSLIGSPVGIEDGEDGLLYVLGLATGFVSVDPATDTVSQIGVAIPGGSYVDLARRPSTPWLYLLRDAGSTTVLDRYDVTSGAFEFGFASSAVVSTPAAIVTGPGGDFYVTGQGAGFVVFDGDSGLEVASNTCMDFPDTKIDIAYTVPGPTGVYCEAKPNSAGCLPSISASGVPGFSQPGAFRITCTDVINKQNGMLFYGFGPNSAPFQGGTLCVQPPLKRTFVMNSGGSPTGVDCSGVFAFDFNAWLQQGSDADLVPCGSVFCQFWYRDPNDPLGFATGLSNALEFQVGL